MAKRKYGTIRRVSPPQVGSLDYILAEVPDGRALSVIWARALAIIGDAQWKAFIAAYDARDTDTQPLEQFCEAAGIDPSDYLAMFAKHSHKYANLEIEVLKAAKLPAVVRKSYDVATTDDGFADRTAILRQEGVHFAPQANQINVTQQTLNQSSLPSMSDFTRDLEQLEGSDSNVRQLSAASTEFIDGELVDERTKGAVPR